MRRYFYRLYKELKYCLHRPEISLSYFLNLSHKNRFWLWHPQHRLQTVGITGTNGKTTVARFLSSILKRAGHQVGQLGTHTHYIGDNPLSAQLTTPDAVTLHHLLSEMVVENVTHLVMEASSHGLAQDRLRDLTFQAAVFTNLSHDHLDYHGTMDSYLSAKMRLFQKVRPDGRILINADDQRSELMISNIRQLSNRQIQTFGLNQSADLQASQIRTKASGTHFQASTPGETFEVEIQLPGDHNVSNALAAIGVAQFFQVPLTQIQNGLRQTVVPGRFEWITKGEIQVVVDFAHSPQALKTLLQTARQLTDNRLICVVSCNGNRDRDKRPLMGQIATGLSDLTIMTSGSPRSEDPVQILAEMESCQDLKQQYQVIADRRQAIENALQTATDGDFVIIAGRGCEAWIEFGTEQIPFDDREVVRSILGC